MGYRIDKQGLLDRMGAWDGFLGRKIHLIACGGTALTLLGSKPSTKDIDLMVPRPDEHRYLTGILNYYDLIISKLFRATALDLEDCILLIRNKRQEIDFARLAARFKETAAFDVSQAQLLKNFEHFISILRKERLLNEK